MRWQEISERVRDAYLYHVTFADDAARIIAQDKMIPFTAHSTNLLGLAGSTSKNVNIRPSWTNGVSLTRDQKFNYRDNGVVFVLDWTLLKQNFKIIPYDHFASRKRGHRYSNARQEAEEFVIGTIEPLSRYLVEIRISKELYDECVEDDEQWTNPEEDSRYWVLTHHPLLKIM